MSNLPVDRDVNYMRKMWGTTRLVTDYGDISPKRVIQEIMHDSAPKHNSENQQDLYEKVRDNE